MSTIDRTDRHPTVFEPAVLGVVVVCAIAGALIGLQLIVALGVTPNTSIIGVLVAIVISRIPIGMFIRFRSVHRQNLVQTAISSATFAAANSLLLPIGIPVLLGEGHLVWPLLAGAALAMVIDLLMLFWMFDTRVFPAKNPWPPGLAASEAIIAGDRGGKRAMILGAGIGVGVLGAWIGLPMSAAGVAFIANIFAMLAFAVGLLIAGNSTALFGVDLGEIYLPHGMMIGAGLVALLQAVTIVVRRRRQPAKETSPVDAGSPTGTGSAADAEPAPAAREATSAEVAPAFTRTDSDALAGLRRGLLLYVGAGVTLAMLGGLYAEMSPVQLVGWIVFAAIACICAEFVVGLSAMHAGWFPAFATALIFLILGMVLGFPVIPLALLVGFVAAGSPAFADAGYDFKAGWVLRGKGENRAFELLGRRQQLYAGLIGMAVSVAVVAVTHQMYFSAGLFPPVDEVYATTIKAGLDPGTIGQLALWALPGALIQLIGGPSRQLGVLLGTGLLVANPVAGWVVLGGLLVRALVLRFRGKEAAAPMTVFAAGLIAGDALFGFFSSVVKASWSR